MFQAPGFLWIHWCGAWPLLGESKHPVLIYARSTQFNKCSYRQLENSQNGEFAAYAHLYSFLRTVCCCFLAWGVVFKPHKGYAQFSFHFQRGSLGLGAVESLPGAVDAVLVPGAEGGGEFNALVASFISVGLRLCEHIDGAQAGAEPNQ